MAMNTAILTATSLLIRGVGMMFQAWLSKRIGASGIGLLQLIMSVSSLAATFAISGIRFTTTRLVSMELGSGSGKGVSAAMKRCILYALFFGCLGSTVMYLGAQTIGYHWIGDARTVLGLRFLALSLPFVAVGSVMSGYFTAVTRIIKSSVAQIFEQVIRIGVTFAALTYSGYFSLEYQCAIIVAGAVSGEIASFAFLAVLYVFDKKKIPNTGAGSKNMTKQMFGIALPLALSAYGRTALTTIENLLIPRGFRKSGSSSEKALADYGVITGMVFPIIVLPQALFHALSELLVPELTDAQVQNNRKRILSIMKRTLTYGFLASLGIMIILLVFSDALGNAIYSNAEVGKYIRIIAYTVPVMYVDSITDGMLRGLGLQVYSMVVNITDSLLSVILVWILLPRYGVAGYIFVIFFGEILNFALSVSRLAIAAVRIKKRKDIIHI